MNKKTLLSSLTIGFLISLQGCARDHDPNATTNVPLDTALKRARTRMALFLEGKTIGQINENDYEREEIEYQKLKKKRHELDEAFYKQLGLNRDEIVEPRPDGQPQ